MPSDRTPTALDQLAEEWLDQQLALTPELHVHLGRPGREGEFTDHSPDGHAAAQEARRAMLARVEKAPVADATDRVTHAELLRTLRLEIETHDAGMWQRDLNVIASPAQDLRDLFDLMSSETLEDWAHVAKRMARVPAAMDGWIASLREGIARGNTPAVRQVTEVIVQAEKLTGSDTFFTRLAASTAAPRSLAADLETGAARAGEAYGTLVAFLRDELAPAARTEDGVGRELYSLASRGFLGATVDLDETYAWGIEELLRMQHEQEAIADQILPGGTVAEAIAHLEADPSLKLHGVDALQAWMQDVSDRSVAELGATHFDIPEPLRRLECCIAPTDEGGIYYTPPSEDFSRPGRMWWSVPPGVTEFETWRELTTVHHEGVPGHHLQCGIAVHNTAMLNGWRRNNWNSGHGEGWALYAERLMDDLGYLQTPADRLGMLDGQRMRAARVVLDIGVHLGLPKPRHWFDDDAPWTGDDAFGFLDQHVAMEPEFVRFEVNRYLGWPGQAPSYKVGQRQWELLRDDWLAQGRGTLKEFHARALALGTVGLETLRSAVLEN